MGANTSSQSPPLDGNEDGKSSPYIAWDRKVHVHRLTRGHHSARAGAADAPRCRGASWSAAATCRGVPQSRARLPGGLVAPSLRPHAGTVTAGRVGFGCPWDAARDSKAEKKCHRSGGRRALFWRSRHGGRGLVWSVVGAMRVPVPAWGLAGRLPRRPARQPQSWRLLVTAQLARGHQRSGLVGWKGECGAESGAGGQCHCAAKTIETVIKRLFHKYISCCMSQLVNCQYGLSPAYSNKTHM